MSQQQNVLTVVLVILVVLVGLGFLGPLMMWGFYGGQGGWPMMGGGMMGGGMMGGWNAPGYGVGMGIFGSLFGLVLTLAFIVLIAFGAYFLLSGRTTLGTPVQTQPIEILRERYAKGEITKEQFLEMKEQLK